MATDGDIDCSAYSKAKVTEALRQIDRARFPINFVKLTRRLQELEATADNTRATVEFEVRDTPEAAAAATRRGIRRSLSYGGVVPPAITVLMLACTLGYVAYLYQNVFTLASPVVFLLALAELYVRQPMRAQRLVKESPTRKLSVSDEELTVVADPCSRTVPWARYRDIVEDDEYFLFGGGTRWNWIPKSQMPAAAVDCIRKVIAQRAD